MRKIIIASVLVVGLAAGFAYAHGNGYGTGYGNHMMGGGYNNMMGSGMMGGYGGNGGYGDCPGLGLTGQGGWNSEPHQKFLDETTGLRKEMNEKRFEYMEAQRNPDATREQFAALEKEMIDIRTKLYDKAEQYR